MFYWAPFLNLQDRIDTIPAYRYYRSRTSAWLVASGLLNLLSALAGQKMPIKYIGKTTNFRGNTLWEIVCNLRDFGVGRVVVRSVFERYPEPTYFRILKAEPDMDEKNPGGRLLVQKVFRGRPFPQEYDISKIAYKPDYRLLHKHEEEAYCRYTPPKDVQERILPRHMPLPPVLKELVVEERKQRGVKEEPMVTMSYLNTWYNNYRIAKDGEKPNASDFGKKLLYIEFPQKQS